MIAQDVSAHLSVLLNMILSVLHHSGEPPCLSFILPAPGKMQLLLLRSHTVNMQHEELCEGCCNLRWLSPFFSLSGSSPADRLLTMILLPPPVILTCHQALLLPSELWLMLISVRPRSKASATWHGDVLLFNWRCTKVKTEILFNPESFAHDCSDVWSGSSPPPAWPEHHPAALMLLCGHAALSKHHRLVFLVKLLFGVLSDHGMLFHTGGGDLIAVWDAKHSYYDMQIRSAVIHFRML